MTSAPQSYSLVNSLGQLHLTVVTRRSRHPDVRQGEDPPDLGTDDLTDDLRNVTPRDGVVSDPSRYCRVVVPRRAAGGRGGIVDPCGHSRVRDARLRKQRIQQDVRLTHFGPSVERRHMRSVSTTLQNHR